MQKSFILFLLLSIVFNGIAQDSVVAGARQQLYAKVLQEKRTFSISVPASYHSKKYTPATYPVLYVLDGETSFEYVAAIVKFLSKGVYAHIPEMIVVGIHNTNRTRDFTPTQAFINHPEDSTQKLFTESGGNAQFNKFLTTELIPYIDSLYRTNGFKIFAGHSFGGLAVTNVLLHYPELFNAYIIHDPSYWWDNSYMLKEASKVIPKTNYNQTRVYLAQAENENKGSFDAHFESIKTFNHIVDSIANPSFAYQYKFYETEDHGTVAVPASFDGLKYIFDGYWADFKKLSTNKEYLTDSYNVFSKKVNFMFLPPEPKLDFIVNYFKTQKNMNAATEALQLYQKLYPKTAPTKL